MLQRLVERTPGATGAIFADWDGEPVDQFAPDIPMIDIQLLGAHFGVVLTGMQERLAKVQLGDIRELVIEGDRSTIMVKRVTAQYYVVLQLKRDGHLGRAFEELGRACDEIRGEM
jgi:predicted regulator of Ras-like GTPase activity (Roadblock/LC7/MglB family)